MTDLTQVIRWNTNFVRGLAQSVLDRAKVIRSGLVGSATEAIATSKPAKKPGKTTTKTTKRKTGTVKTTSKRGKTARRRG